MMELTYHYNWWGVGCKRRRFLLSPSTLEMLSGIESKLLSSHMVVLDTRLIAILSLLIVEEGDVLGILLGVCQLANLIR